MSTLEADLQTDDLASPYDVVLVVNNLHRFEAGCNAELLRRIARVRRLRELVVSGTHGTVLTITA